MYKEVLHIITGQYIYIKLLLIYNYINGKKKEGIIKTLKQNEYYEKPSAKRARKKKEGIKNTRKRMAKFALKSRPNKRRYL